MKRIKIIRCSDSLMWYNSQIGFYLEIIREEEDVYWVREPAGYLNIVLKKDAEVSIWCEKERVWK